MSSLITTLLSSDSLLSRYSCNVVSSCRQRLPLIEEQLGTLLTDDFSAVGTFLGKYSDPVHLNQNHIFHKYGTMPYTLDARLIKLVPILLFN